MALDRHEYPALLALLSPTQALEILGDRARTMQLVNANISDWLEERRKLDEIYATGLKRLAQRNPIADTIELGILAKPWSTLTSRIEQLAQCHTKLANKIEADVERPLRNFVTSNQEYSSLSTMQSNLGDLVREVDTAQKKLEKITGGSTNHSFGRNNSLTSSANLTVAQTELENAQGAWNSQAPFVFETLQAADERRMDNLRNLLTLFLTHETDRIETDKNSAEACLNAMLTVETDKEIKMFAARVKDAHPNAKVEDNNDKRSELGRHEGNNGISDNIHSSDRPRSQRSTSYLNDAKLSFHGEDRRSIRSGSVTTDVAPTPSAPASVKEKDHTPRGLRRLGTLLSRRRESKVPSGAERLSESPDSGKAGRKSRLQASSTFSSFSSSRKGKSKDGMQMLESTREDDTDHEETRRSPLRKVLHTRSELGNENSASGLGSSEGPSSAGLGFTQNNAASKSTGDLIAQREEQSSASYAIAQAEREAAITQNSFTPQPSFKMDIKNAPTPEEPASDTILNNMVNTLRLQAPSSLAIPKRSATTRGRRDNRASVYDFRSNDGDTIQNITPSLTSPSPVSSTSQNVISSTLPSQQEESPLPRSASSLASLPHLLPGSSPFSPFAPLLPESPLQKPLPVPTTPNNKPLPNAPNLPETVTPITNLYSTNYFPRSTSITNPFQTKPGPENDGYSIRSGKSQTSSSMAGSNNRHPDMNVSGLGVSVIETVSAWFEGGNLTRQNIHGEIGMTYGKTGETNDSLAVKISGQSASAIERLVPNPAFLESVSQSTEDYNNDQDSHYSHIFKVDVASLSRQITSTQPQIGFKYQLSTSVMTSMTPPVIIHPKWKFEKGQISVILSYHISPAFFSTSSSNTITVTSLTLALYLPDDLISTSSNQSVNNSTSTREIVKSCLSKPVGTFNKDKGFVFWNLGNVIFTQGETEKKVLARFVTEGGDETSQERNGGKAEVKFCIEGVICSGLNIQVNTGGDFSSQHWQRLDDGCERRRLVAGIYQGT